MNRFIEKILKGAFTGTRALCTQTYVEANIKLGAQHEISVLIEGMANGGINDTLFITGSTPVILKERTASFTGNGVHLDIFEGSTYTDVGTPIPSYNLSNIINTPAESVFYAGPTGLVPGTQAFSTEFLIGNTSNQGKGGTNHVAGFELILRPNTAYTFRVTSVDASQDVAMFDTWYEGPLDLPTVTGLETDLLTVL